MNSVNITGRITHDLELRRVENVQEPFNVVEFTIAVDRQNGKDEADFIRCKVSGKQADNLVQYQGKGSKVGVSGRLRQESWEDKETSKQQSKTLVSCGSIEYLENKNATQVESSVTSQDITEDLPF